MKIRVLQLQIITFSVTEHHHYERNGQNPVHIVIIVMTRTNNVFVIKVVFVMKKLGEQPSR